MARIDFQEACGASAPFCETGLRVLARRFFIRCDFAIKPMYKANEAMLSRAGRRFWREYPATSTDRRELNAAKAKLHGLFEELVKE